VACFGADGRSLRGCARLLEGPAAESSATPISALDYDSRAVRPGALFCCIPGYRSDGHNHAPAALDAGASALLVERPLELGVPEVRVDSVRAALGPLSDAFFGHPSQALSLVGVTGTNGKTTTTFLVRALLEQAGVGCGLMGTVKRIVGAREEPAARTTPEAPDINRALAQMVAGGSGACAMEVSSHALALYRTDGLAFACAIFTNLTQDHLDFHRSIEEYFAAKRRLFESSPRSSVINVGDRFGARLAAEAPAAVTFALVDDAPPELGTAAAQADFRARIISSGPQGSRFQLDHPGGSDTVTLSLPGRFNVENALGALAALHALGFELQPLLPALERPLVVPGRMEAIDVGQPFTVLIDYAHTPDSLARVLAAARELLESAPARTAGTATKGRLLCVFGAGGDRDRAKRPLMGEAAARGADLLIVSSDNPRSERPEAIIAEIMEGVERARRKSGAPDTEVIVDRGAAIEQAIALAEPGDIVLIAGKGHERGQELEGGRIIPFDDALVAREAIERAAASGAWRDPERGAGGADLSLAGARPGKVRRS